MSVSSKAINESMTPYWSGQGQHNGSQAFEQYSVVLTSELLKKNCRQALLVPRPDAPAPGMTVAQVKFRQDEIME